MQLYSEHSSDFFGDVTKFSTLIETLPDSGDFFIWQLPSLGVSERTPSEVRDLSAFQFNLIGPEVLSSVFSLDN